jgi:hypothetical protein
VRFVYSGVHLSKVVFENGPGAPTHEFEYSAADGVDGERINQLRRALPPRGAGSYGWICRYIPDGRLKQVDDPQEVYLAEGDGDTAAPLSRVAKLLVRYDESKAPIAPRETYVTDRRGFQTKYVVEPRRSLVKEIHEPTGPVTRRFFDQFGNLTDVIDRWGARTTYKYQTSGATPAHVRDNLIEIWLPKGAGNEKVSSFVYTTDGFNQVAEETSYVTPTDGAGPVPRTTTHAYNGFAQRIQTIFPPVALPTGTGQTASMQYEYDGPRRQLTQITNEEGHKTRYSDFDGTSGQARIIQRDGGSTPDLFEYDLMGNLYARKGPKGGPSNDDTGWIVFQFDRMYRLISSSDAAGAITRYDYDLD